MEIFLPTGEWMINQGLVGFVRIARKAGHHIEMKQDGICFDSSIFNTMAKDYFTYFLEKFSVADRDEARLKKILSRCRKEETFKEAKKKLDESLKRTWDKAKNYCSDTAEGTEMSLLIEQIKGYDQFEDIEQIEKEVNRYLDLLKTPFINEKQTVNFFKLSILQPYFGQNSFLNISLNKLTIEEQIQRIHQDYIVPILCELKLKQLLMNAEDENQLLSWLKECPYKPIKNLHKTWKKTSLADIRENENEQFLSCSFFDEWYAFEHLNEGHFVPLQVSSSNALNYFWDFDNEMKIPISNLAKFILFCAPAGAALSPNGNQSSFVQIDGSMNKLFEVNERYALLREEENPLNEIIFDLVTELKEKGNANHRNYLFIDYSSDYRLRKTILNYFDLPRSLSRFFVNEHELLKRMHYSLRNALAYDFLTRRDAKWRIFNVLRQCIEKKYSSLDAQTAVVVRHLYQKYLEGDGDVKIDSKTESKSIWFLYNCGREVRQKYVEKGQEPKVQGIAYRLLNATKANNKKTFMDSLIRVYMSLELPMPSLFLQVLHEEKLDFATVANAFIAGLVSQPNDKQPEGGNE
ncbi:type I-B CRISPR-associated protein Cas8b1/Cst1 [Aeribacillus composti]|uniref:type I-B CRISPR-associated protein Cas8b1/Cst1 n=1 Tax=Aeribacillus composti TaxID=1868734 RepID=UPI002E1E2BE5|nr:type I-B CRISPR-associated protein Cas8b1/Cst1 [Aeribacillus composti]MED0747120.1 type I-B CRISPR-associated protein Cas8b1/Cst1 [Aeribacillus composti]